MFQEGVALFYAFMPKNNKKLLGKLAKHLGLDLPYLIKNSSFVLIRQVIGAISGVILAIAFARFTPIEVYGEYTFLFSIISVAALTALPGMNTAILRSSANQDDQGIVQGTRFRLKTSFIGSLLTIAFLTLFQTNLSPESRLAGILLAASLPILYSFNSYPNFLLGKQRFDTASLYLSISNVLIVTAQFFGIMFYKTLLPIIILFILSTVISDIYLFSKSLKYKVNTKSDPQLISYGLLLTGATSLTYISRYIDKVIAGIFLGPSALAVYSIAKTIPEGIINNIKGLLNVSIVRYIPKGEWRSIEALRTHWLKLVMAGTSLTIISFVFFPIVYPILFSSAYQQSVQTATVLSLIFILHPLNILFSNVVTFQQKQTQIVFLSFFPSIPKIILYFLLLPTYGILGLAWAHVLGEVMLSSYFAYVYFITKIHEK